jgi:cytochrome c553
MTKRKIIKTTALGLVGLIVLILGIIYTWSNIFLNKRYSIPLSEIRVPSDAVSVAEGERLVHIAHCGDCHGEHLTGHVFEGIPKNIATIVAPNLTRKVPTYSDAEIVRLLRYGVKKNGHSLLIMPAFMYHELKEESIGKIIAYLRTLPMQPTAPNLPSSSSYALVGRLLLVQGKVDRIADLIAPGTEGKYVHCDSTGVSFGRYLTMSTCTACHGTDLKGEDGFSPDLVIAASYGKNDFFKLIRTGVALGDRKNIGLMSDVTKKYLSHLNDREIESIYAFLQTRPTQSQSKK